MEISPWGRLFRRAQARGGVVTAADASLAGVPRSTFHRRVRVDAWVHVLPGAWLVPGATMTSMARLWAALLTSGPEASLSHGTAARLLHLGDRSRDMPRRIHVVRPYGRGSKAPPGVVVHRSRNLVDRDLAVVDGLTVTTASRTLMDIAQVHPIWQLEAMMLTARQRGMVDVASLVAQYERRPGLDGAGAFRAAATLLTEDGADSVLERRARRALRTANLHPTRAPHPVACGDITLHVDIAFPERQVGIECDGFAHHGPQERDAFERDRPRSRLLDDAGWRVIPLTWRQLHEDPAAFVDEVRRKLEA